MKVKRVRVYVEEYEREICEICKSRESKSVCRGCKRSICRSRSCGVERDWEVFIGMSCGEYGYRLCKECNERLRGYEREVGEMHERHEREIEEIERRWLRDCREGESNDIK